MIWVRKTTMKVSVVPHLPPSCNIFNVVFLQNQQIVSIFAKQQTSTYKLANGNRTRHKMKRDAHYNITKKGLPHQKNDVT